MLILLLSKTCLRILIDLFLARKTNLVDRRIRTLGSSGKLMARRVAMQFVASLCSVTKEITMCTYGFLKVWVGLKAPF
ncbi:hypothetical protein I3842_10G089900 [Carya illinoinensis]|uniref:Uncharacterized protein n=1 Tax=Carya illinoinensis TaxID=32201 RepID=A0A922DY49_CARIL|nr:hypothetical protein I3842_10G089900 [Carya illinoinensis]